METDTKGIRRIAAPWKIGGGHLHTGLIERTLITSTGKKKENVFVVGMNWKLVGLYFLPALGQNGMNTYQLLVMCR